MVEAVVEFDYVGQESDELTLRKGDVIRNIQTQPGGWWEGTLNGKRGMFPDNFVKVLSETDEGKDSNNVSLRSSSGRQCKVLYSYQPANEDELKLVVDDVIDILAEVEEGWWKGRLGDTVGVFPSNFVTEIVDTRIAGVCKPRTSSREEASESDGEMSTSVSSPDSSQVLESGSKPEQDSEAPVLPPKPVKEVCRALFPYEAANEDELTLKEGDLITLLSREVADKGWWRGELRGKVGVFPDNFVEAIQQEEQQHKKPDRPPAKSQVVTTNRARDSITKPAVIVPAASTTKGDPFSQRKLSDTVLKADERPTSSVSSIPSFPSKKLSFPPPPVKKPQRGGSSNLISAPLTKHDSPAEQRGTPDAVDGAGLSRPVQKTSPRGLMEFDSVERSAMLTHPTATRVKAPHRRLPSAVHNKEADSQNTGLMNGSAEMGHTPQDNHVEEEGEDEGVERSRGRAWERGKAPWVEELKLNQAKKTSGFNSAASVLGQSPSEQSEKKVPKMKPDPSPESKQTPASVTMRMHPSRPQSMFHNPSSRVNVQTRPLSSASPPDPAHLLAEVSQARSRPLSGSSTNSLVLTQQQKQEAVSPSVRTANSTSSSTSPVLATLLSKQTADSTSPSSLSDPDLLASPSARSPGLAGGSSVTYRQFSELKDKVSKLEQMLEAQEEKFMKMVTDLTAKLNEEAERRVQLQQAMDKLTNLVTQV
ncbi:CD2-associated protein isoform X2 [Cryptotermes secundus]|uniref:CD2-associated protein isoform X2 n=1 Tax=Cryptotermes secundus TaxID=105785 RepID=UPI000CD7DA9A|nr:CD2-associated protein isoform X2 [Cryptotermes secundus]